MFLPRPWDGVVLALDRELLLVKAVVPGTGGAEAGLRPGDRIVGVARSIVRSPGEVARLLAAQREGATVPYLVLREGSLVEVPVRLSARRLSTPLFVYAAFTGFFFFAVGLFVVVARPEDAPAAPSRVFFILSTLFMVFLVCRLRPASYSFFDGLVLTTGTLSLLALPAAFLHFFLVFPRRQEFSFTEAPTGFVRAVQDFINTSPHLFTVLYALPPATYAVSSLGARVFGWKLRFFAGAPVASWVLLGDYLVLGVLALLRSLLRAEEARERRQMATVFAGTAIGVVPFILLAVILPAISDTEQTLALAVVSFVAIPVAFAYAIVRFQLLDVRVVIRRSLLYTLTTATLTALYALALAAANALARHQGLVESRYFPLLFALMVVALFDPLRRRIQGPVDRFFFRDMVDARRAVEELSEALTREFSLPRLDQWLTGRLREIMKLSWVVLYRGEGRGFVTSAHNPGMPEVLPAGCALVGELRRLAQPVRLGQLEGLALLDQESASFLARARQLEAKLLAPLVASGELYGFLVVGPKLSEDELSREEEQLLRTVANQGAVGLENARFLREHTRQMELEKELEVARQVQFSLIPEQIQAPAPWRVAARCVPAYQVGGDFYDVLPTPQSSCQALVLGDVAGKSVAGAMLMVAAREALRSAALEAKSPAALLAAANARLYRRERRVTLAVTYLLLCPEGQVVYCLAGQPAPLLRRRDGSLVELPLPGMRLPLGALANAQWEELRLHLDPGDLLFLYSDGLPDARSRDGEPLGEQRLKELLAQAPREADGVVEHVIRFVSEFSGDGQAFDDVTVMAVTWKEGL
ncbi:MAG: SpoIIE family protein phosphatase [Thermoanaerobaculum sp.]|nr:SpoIIE family protein phosphatase [Thermoanaerobaculum sp.]